MILEKYKNSSRANKNFLKAALLLFAVVLMIASALIVKALIKDPETPPKDPVEFDAEMGESSYLGLPVAYPIIDSSQMQNISVLRLNEDSGKLEYSFALSRLGVDVYKNQFVLSYTNADGLVVNYEPDITKEDSYFNYDDIFSSATSSQGGYAMPKITYVTSAVGVLYFDARIDFTEEMRDTVLERYGFGADSPIIYVKAKDAEGKDIEHTIRIGKKLITDSAYYFTVDDRPCVYATRTNYFDYALTNFESFIHTTLISAGLQPDSSYAPIVTPGYEQWTNTVYKYREDEEGKREYYFVKDGDEKATDPWLVSQKDKVIVNAYQISPYTKPEDDATAEELQAMIDSGYIKLENGYLVTNGVRKLEIDLGDTSGMREAKYVLSALIGKAAGEYDGLSATVLGDYIPVKFPENMPFPAAQYSFTITHIESVFEEGVEKKVGTELPNEAVKVTYNVSINNVEDEYAHHAILTLDRNLFPDVKGAGNEEKYEALVNADVGELDEPIIIKDAYTVAAKSGVTCTVEEVLTDIVLIYDANLANLGAVKEDSFVLYRRYIDYVYNFTDSNGNVTELYRTRIEGEKPKTLDMTKASEDLKKALVGKTLNLAAGAYSVPISEAMIKCTPFMAFEEYDVREITSVVRSEIVVSFAIADEIDPFLRESVYENTLENKYHIYDLNSQACESVIHLLGGLGGNAGTAEGLKGLETVAVGITADVKERFGLYSKTIRFKLPRLLYDKNTGNPDASGDSEDEEEIVENEGFIGAFNWHEELEFTLYISEADEFGYRYVGSDLYDIVAKVNASDFAFLDESFIDLWVRRSLVLVNVTDVERIKVELNMEDVYGEYEFRLAHVNKDGGTKTSVFAAANLSKPISDSKFAEYVKENGVQYGSSGMGEYLSNFYLDVAGLDMLSKNESYGDANFKAFLQTLYSVYYTDTLTAEEQEKYLDSREPLMTIRFDLLNYGKSGKTHFFEFRRIDDGRVMVTYYRNGLDSTPVSDMCISSFAFKKLVYTFLDLLNAEDVDSDLPTGHGEE